MRWLKRHLDLESKHDILWERTGAQVSNSLAAEVNRHDISWERTGAQVSNSLAAEINKHGISWESTGESKFDACPMKKFTENRQDETDIRADEKAVT